MDAELKNRVCWEGEIQHRGHGWEANSGAEQQHVKLGLQGHSSSGDAVAQVTKIGNEANYYNVDVFDSGFSIFLLYCYVIAVDNMEIIQQ